MLKKSRNKLRKRKHFRIRQKISGTHDCPRINVFKSLKNFEAQLIDDQNHKTLFQLSSIKLKLKNGSNIKAAIEVGKNFGKKLKEMKVSKIVFDRSGYIFHGKIKAFADAIRNEGIKF